MKKSSKKWTIPLVCGIIVGLIGITLIIVGATMSVPSMGEQGWFDSSSKQMMLCGFGAFLTIAGFSTGAFASFVTYRANPENRAKMVEMQQQEEKLFREALKARGIDIDGDNKEKPITCKYCGTENKAGSTKCSSCGAGLSKQK